LLQESLIGWIFKVEGIWICTGTEYTNMSGSGDKVLVVARGEYQITVSLTLCRTTVEETNLNEAAVLFVTSW
jgi:hypothetical protein